MPSAPTDVGPSPEGPALDGPPWDVVVTCGGTGGHVVPALAVVDALCAAGVARDRIGFVGGHRMEATMVPAAGVDFVALDVAGLVRSLSPKGVARNARIAVRTLRALRQARSLLRARHVQVVVCMGGYASMPATLAAGSRPVVAYEANSVAGLAVKVAARRAARTGVAFRRTTGELANAERLGFLVRPGLRTLDRAALAAEAGAHYGVTGRRVVAVTGGSLGAKSLNEATIALAEAWADRDDLAIVHLTGASGADAVAELAAARLAPDAKLAYVPVAFEDRMERIFALADVLVCRSGASTCAELVATRTPAVCVPYPYHRDQQQLHNAEELADAGLVEIVADAELADGALTARLGALLDDPDRLDRMRAGAATLGEADAADRIAAIVVGLLGDAQEPAAQ